MAKKNSVAYTSRPVEKMEDRRRVKRLQRASMFLPPSLPDSRIVAATTMAKERYGSGAATQDSTKRGRSLCSGERSSKCANEAEERVRLSGRWTRARAAEWESHDATLQTNLKTPRDFATRLRVSACGGRSVLGGFALTFAEQTHLPTLPYLTAYAVSYVQPSEMASAGESSLDSMPMPDIAALHDHLLQNDQSAAVAQASRPQPDGPHTQPQIDESHLAQEHPHTADDIIAESPNVAAPSPSKLHAQPPRLNPSKSAPAYIDAMAHQNTSQDATMARAASFHGYAGGDTQPMESQIYRDYTESMTRPSGTTPKKTILHFEGFMENEQNTYGTIGGNDKSQFIMDEGDAGFVDLDMPWQRDDSPTAKSATSGIEELLAGPETQSQIQGANGSFAPKTPGYAGHRRGRSGEIPTSATDFSKKTPAFSQVFGITSKLPALSATQMFDQTQAPSSPTVDAAAAHSDPIADRPSPNLNANRQLSPDVASSSPVLMMHNPPASTAGEPRDIYTSMRESQERRAARLRQELDLTKRFGPSAIAELEEDEEDDSQQIRLDKKRLHRVMSDQAMDEWSKYRAPARTDRSSDRKRPATIDLVTPGTLHKHNRVQFDLLDDEPETDDEVEDAELPGVAEDTHDGEGLPDSDVPEDYDDDNDVYDEFGQTVLRSQRDPDDEDDGHSTNGNDENMDDDDSISGSRHDPGEAEHINGADIEMSEADVEPDQRAPSTQPAVADSQPERLNAQRSLLSKDLTGQPHTSSIVPGSQYVGATSQELARHSARIPNSSVLSQSRINGSARSQDRERRVPSSPPIPGESSAEQEEQEDVEDVNILKDSELPRSPKEGISNECKTLGREIPESDQPENFNMEHVQEESIFETAAESNTVAPFSTAQTHFNESAPTPEKPRLVKELSKASASQQSMPTPLKAAGVRRFADIAGDPSPSEFNAESQLDMDAIMGNVITMDDQTFMDVLSSPPSEKPTKRRRLLDDDQPRKRSRMPSMEAADAGSGSESMRESSPAKAAIHEEPASPEPAIAPVKAVQTLRESPSKATEPPSASPESKDPETPESVRRRERAGSKAASQLLSARLNSTRKAKNAKPTKTERKVASPNESKRASASRRTSSKLKKSVESTAEKELDGSSELPQEQEAGHVEEDDGKQEEQSLPIPDTSEQAQTLSAHAPERVLALFRGAAYNAYYPATWLSTSADGKSHRIRFDDTTVTTLDDHHVRALEFKIGDAVKVDYEGYRSKTWLVKAFGRTAQSEEDRANGVDVHNHVTLYVQAKVTLRSSMPAQGAAVQGEGDLQEIMVTNVKITHNMITHFADRAFHPPNRDANAAVSATPSTEPQSADSDTPRSRRILASTTKSVGRERSKLRDESVATSTEPSNAGIFEGMAFAISYASNENEKFDVTRLIRRNGGIVLEQGFDELFVTSQLDEPTTPSKRSSKKAGQMQAQIESGELRLKPENEGLGFIALIADKHSRRAKYMQALALDLPTLSGRWILDSLDSSRNPQFATSPRPWNRYLLPAGESSYLGGAVRSRTLQHYDPSSAKLPSTVASRERLLAGAGVLLVAPKKGRGTWQLRKAYAFLTLALGAGSVRRVADLAEAKKLLASTGDDKDKWAWVYVDDDVGEAAKVLFGARGATGASKKRKRNEGAQMCVQGMQGRVRVVGDEFVVQSLILGALVD
ncbi:hypothetical protein Q7P37_000692 [Cladosporium fusiforme]